MPTSLALFLLSFLAVLAVPFVEFLNTPYRAIPTIALLGIVSLCSVNQVMRFYGSKAPGSAKEP